MFASARHIGRFGSRIRLGLRLVCAFLTKSLVLTHIFFNFTFVGIPLVALTYADVIHDVSPVK